MASLRNVLEQHLAHQVYAFYDEEDPAAVVQDVFTRVMVIDSRKISDSTIILVNDDAGSSIDYQIFGSNKFVDIDNSPAVEIPLPETVAPAVADPSWFNLLSADPHDNSTLKTIPAKTALVGWACETFSNKWAFVQILAKTSKVGGSTAKISHRGTNTH